jgi:hypothetical protein
MDVFRFVEQKKKKGETFGSEFRAESVAHLDLFSYMDLGRGWLEVLT